MKPAPNVIKEVHPGIFWALLDFPAVSIAAQLLDPAVPLSLCWSHHIGDYTWQEFELPLTDPRSAQLVRSRGASFDFLIPTVEFLPLVSHFTHHLNVAQLHSTPPDFLDLARMRGRPLYSALNQCGWHIILELPGNDFGQVTSPSRAVVERAIDLSAAA